MEYLKIKTDVLIIGGGGAGLRAAVAAADCGAQVILVSKRKVGIAGATAFPVAEMAGYNAGDIRIPGDTQSHYEDIMKAAQGMADPKLAAITAANAPGTISKLEEWGVEFEHVEEDYYIFKSCFSDSPRTHVIKGHGEPIIKALMKQIELRKENIKIMDDVTILRLVKENERRGVIIQAIYRSNFVLFGIPLATSVFGEEGTLLATMMVAIVIPVYNITAVVILELFRGGKVPVSVLIKNILKNPMIRGALLGFIFHILGIKLPVSVEGPIKQFANLTTPLALFVLGGTLHFNAIGGNLKYVVPSMTFKMVILPAVILAVATLLGFSGVERFVYFEMYATPVATASYAMAQNMGGDGELAGQFVVLSTVASVVTIFLWVYFLNSIGWLA